MVALIPADRARLPLPAELRRDQVRERAAGGRTAAGSDRRRDLGRRIALGVDGVPRAAELEDVVAEDLANGVVDVEVEGVALVGHLPATVAALDGADQVPVDAAAGTGTALGVERRPSVGARAIAASLSARVAGEEVEGAVAAIEEDGAELGVAKGHERPAPSGGRVARRAAVSRFGCSLFGRRCAPRRSGLPLVVASAAAHQREAGDQCYGEAWHVTGLQRVRCRGSRDGGDSLRMRKDGTIRTSIRPTTR